MHLWRSATWKANRNCVRNYFPSIFIAFSSIWFDKGAFIGRRQKANNRRRKNVKNLWRERFGSMKSLLVQERKLLCFWLRREISSSVHCHETWVIEQFVNVHQDKNRSTCRDSDWKTEIRVFPEKTFSSTPWLPLAKTCFRQTRASDRLLAFLSFEKFHNLSTPRLSLQDDISMKCERRKT